MAKRKGANALHSVLVGTVGTITSLAIGEAFISGLFTGGLLLSLLPLIVHQVVGWIIVVSTIIALITAMTSK